VALKCEAEGAPTAKAEALIQADKAEALSPATPLSFPPSSESDKKPKQDWKRKFPLKMVFLSFLFSFSINFLDKIQFSWCVDY
jgi:hypothetical protein